MNRTSRTRWLRPASPGRALITGKARRLARYRRVSTLARVGLALGLPVLMGVAVVGVAQPARAAATLTVSTCDESDLDAAVAQADSDNAGDIITFACSGTISLTSTLDITGSMTLDGTGQQVTLDGQGQVGVLSMASGITFTLNNLTVADGSAADGAGGLVNSGGTVNITGSNFGGNEEPALDNSGGTVNITNSTFNGNHDGISALTNRFGGTVNITNSTFQGNVGGNGAALNNNASTATITGSLFRGNSATNSSGANEGGAIINSVSTNAATLRIADSSFIQNQALSGGAIYSIGSGLTITNSSFSENLANAKAGAIYVDSTGTTNISFSSFFDNQAADVAGGGNLDVVEPSKVDVEGSVLAAGNPDNCGGVAPVDQDYNLETGTDCGFTGTGDLQNADAQLTNTGPDFSLILTQGSPGIDAVPVSLCPVADENGNPRPDDPAETTCDMGATESDYPPALVVSSSANPSTSGQPVTVTAVVPATDGGGTVAFSVPGAPDEMSGCAAQPLILDSGGSYSATCTSIPHWVGTETVLATYSGDAAFPGSTAGSVPGGQTVDPATALSSSQNPSIAGQPVTFTATVSPTDGGGSVAFYADGSTTPVSGCGAQSLTQSSGSTYTAACTTTALPAGSHTISATYSGDSSYPGSSGTLPGGQTVNPAPLTADVAGSQTYGGSPAFAAIGYSGLVNGGTPSVVTGTLTGCTTTVGPGAGVGVYPGTISGCAGLSSPNYTISYSDAEVTVTPAPLMITASSGAMTYGGTPPVITPAYSGFVNGDGPSSLSSAPTCSATATSSPVGTYPSSCTGAADPNYAISYVSGQVSVGQAAQSISITAPATRVAGKSATVNAAGGGSGNPVVFSVDPASGTGVCTVSGTNGATVNYAAAGSCVIDANQAGTTNYAPAPQVTTTITVNQAPAFVLDSPPLTAVAGQEYDYTFDASGTPAPAYALASGAPSWLSVNVSTGEVTGTPPAGTTSFSYAVTATNTAGAATAGPFTVTTTKPSPAADISTALACPASITVGSTGTCTLTVANAGPATASKVIAAVLLPAALSELSCTPSCTRHANVFTWTLASLASGASAEFAITLKASAAGKIVVLAAAASQNPDPKPLNNIAISQITIKH